jgi:alkylated DNA repair dioxygenase AlkB
MIPGLFYFPNVLSADFSREIKEYLEKSEDWFPVGGSATSREVIHYGYKYDYKNGNIKEVAKEFPDFARKLVGIIKEKIKFQDEKDSDFSQCLVNKYVDNQGIAAHIDALTFGKYICCFTIGNGANLRFSKGKGEGDDFFDLYTEPNSLYVMSGEARYSWKHEMKKLKFDVVNNKKIKRGERISVTFRTIL